MEPFNICYRGGSDGRGVPVQVAGFSPSVGGSASAVPLSGLLGGGSGGLGLGAGVGEGVGALRPVGTARPARLLRIY